MGDMIVNSQYEILEEIGRGRFGIITRCFCPISGKFFACKTIAKSDLVDETDKECLEKEPKIMAILPPHPNILRLVDVLENDDYLCLISELCDSISLYDRIVRRPFSEPEAAVVMKQLLEALYHCHFHGVVHRDVKPDNVLFDSRNNLKLIDFGSAEWCEKDGFMYGVVGTPFYVAPEVLRGSEYGRKVDVWSAGVILYTMLAGFRPFYGESATDVFEAVLRGNLRFPTRVFRSVSSAAKDLIKKMICRDVSKRFSAEQALRHPWISSGGGGTASV
ncbi:phosphoenolpyruvate carboxylase kinase 1-like [Cucurbita moschata]|uniref:Phosphoenolpyruvate carboxylase kinase 1-like n=1 Tax=Cucurbita moschata TaxID=3662 RepID=A0A6J1EZB8_CUCMO|nr:phosphoenolpyruvate carboxylase kinase 1-like [Cucurbita moschata]